MIPSWRRRRGKEKVQSNDLRSEILEKAPKDSIMNRSDLEGLDLIVLSELPANVWRRITAFCIEITTEHLKPSEVDSLIRNVSDYRIIWGVIPISREELIKKLASPRDHTVNLFGYR